MGNIYLKHKNNKNTILECDSDFTPLNEISSLDIPPRAKAFYVNFPDGYIGVYSSKNGPVLFINHNKYLFTDQSWKSSVQEGLTNNAVHFSNLREPDLSFEYKKIELDLLDPWSEKQFDDFFIWLSLKRGNHEFIEMWTDNN